MLMCNKEAGATELHFVLKISLVIQYFHTKLALVEEYFI